MYMKGEFCSISRQSTFGQVMGNLIHLYLTEFLFVSGEIPLGNLIDVEKKVCLESLAQATDQELWKFFLDGQTELFFEQEFACLGHKSWWQG